MSSLQELVNQIINWGSGILLVVGFLAAAIYTGIHIMGAMGADDPLKKKQAIKNVIWVWVCALAIALIPTFVLIFKGEILAEIGKG